MKVITAEILHHYEACKGDPDGVLKNGTQLLSLTNSWTAITNAMQDIQLINSRRCSDIYAARVLSNWKEVCDPEAFDAFTKKVIFYADFQAVAELLQQINCKITPATDTVWAGFDSPAAFKAELKQDIANIRNCSFATLEKIFMEFAPTSSYQELSHANNWSAEYVKLAEEFDSLYCRLVGSKKCADLIKPARQWWKFW